MHRNPHLCGFRRFRELEFHLQMACIFVLYFVAKAQLQLILELTARQASMSGSQDKVVVDNPQPGRLSVTHALGEQQ
jgi:hypothetical protein